MKTLKVETTLRVRSFSATIGKSGASISFDYVVGGNSPIEMSFNLSEEEITKLEDFIETILVSKLVDHPNFSFST